MALAASLQDVAGVGIHCFATAATAAMVQLDLPWTAWCQWTTHLVA